MTSQGYTEADIGADIETQTIAWSVASEDTDVLINEAQKQRKFLLSASEQKQSTEESLSYMENPRFDPNAGARCKTLLRKTCSQELQHWASGEEEPSRYFQLRLGHSADSLVSLSSPRCYQPYDGKSIRSTRPQSIHGSSLDNIPRNSGLTDLSSQDKIQDIVDDVVGDEIYCNPPTVLFNYKSVDGDDEAMSKIYPHATCAAGTSQGNETSELKRCISSTSEAIDLGSIETKEDQTTSESKLTLQQQQPILCDSGLKQLISTQIESAASQFSSSSSDSTSTPGEIVQGLQHVAEPAVVPSRGSSSGSSFKSEEVLSKNSEATELGATQDGHVALLKTLLVEKDEEINQYRDDTKKLQHVNKQLMEEKSFLISENERFRREISRTFESEASELDRFAYNPRASSILQQQIVHLRSQINDLQEANESAVHELAKADEEISQLRNNLTKQKIEYSQELEDTKQENDYLKAKILRLNGDSSSTRAYDSTFDLQEEISQLRLEARKLRKANHKLDEVNHLLKEELWDIKRQYEQLRKPVLEGKTDHTDSRKEGGDKAVAKRIGLYREDLQINLDDVLQFQFKTFSPLTHGSRYEPTKTGEEQCDIKHEEANNFTNGLSVVSWKEKEKECSGNGSSPSSLSSDSTEILVAGYKNGLFCNNITKKDTFKDVLRKQIAHTIDDTMSDVSTEILLTPSCMYKLCNLKENQILSKKPQSSVLKIKEKIKITEGVYDDQRELSNDDDDISSISQIKDGFQRPAQHNSILTLNRTSRENPAVARCGLSKHSASRLTLPRRPFAPKDIADLKVGNLVKFSRPAGKISKGTIKYLGHMAGRQDVYLGVELEGSDVGKHDGTFEGIRYFLCKPSKGVFVNFSKVIMAWE
nr:PREDICTED: uncharacterized protein LOC106703278 [Latimeria chalumnae]|eukprot:XP_014343284.1 PREDICTED: uncharacterized protein LOC106703278 [Latimeria chalumnae]